MELISPQSDNLNKETKTRKIKVEICHNNRKFNFIPGIPYWLMNSLLKTIISVSSKKKKSSDVMHKISKKEISEMVNSLRYYEPFVLIDVEDQKEQFRLVVKTV